MEVSSQHCHLKTTVGIEIGNLWLAY